jgi:trk system potassium uptake protein TrkA
MRVVIIGAGQVGRSIAQELQHEHDVVVIERSSQRLALLQQYDVLAIQGNGASLKVLQQAEVDKADLVIASTDVDEVNIVACAGSKQLGAAFTIARVHDPEYIETWERGRLGVDFMVCSELLTSEKIAQLIGVPAAREIHTFVEGRVLMAELAVDEGSPLLGRPLQALDLPPGAMIVSLIRNGRVIIPRGDDVVQAGDLMVSIGTPEAISRLNRRATGRPLPQSVVILGGGRIGYRLALTLERRSLRPKIIEADPERSRWLAEQLSRTQVFQSDATDLDFLEREHLGEADVGVSVMDKDEKNLLSALLLKSLGVKRVIVGVADPDYIEIFERVGIDVAVSARKVIAEEILRFTKSRIAGMSILEGDRAEVLELTVSESSPLVGVPLQDASFPKGAIIGAIVRGKDVIIPHGENALQPGDRVIVFSKKEVAPEVEKLL